VDRTPDDEGGGRWTRVAQGVSVEMIVHELLKAFGLA
jgi:hypothetical protein